MPRGSRRLKNLDLDGTPNEEAAGQERDDTQHVQEAAIEESNDFQHVQEKDDLAPSFEEFEDDETLEAPPEIDRLIARMPQQRSHSPIKIKWPNGDMRQVLGDFTLTNLLQIRGKVLVGTDENGVPNSRSASILGQHLGQLAETGSFAPLHIQRWDNAMFKAHKEKIIKDVEQKFEFPRETIHLTRDWVLRTINNRWRAYKSKLKKQYFNREERSLEDIIKDKPPTVNEVQWRALVGFWCQEQHKKLCATNSRCAKEQKNTHTTGRKSHARLKKEMEDTRKRKVHRLELWEAAHKKKNGRFSTEKVEALMEASSMEIQKRKEKNNGEITAQDVNDVFNDIVAKDFKARGYYDDKYWSGLGVSQGVKFVTQIEAERRNNEKLEAMENRMSRMGTVMLHWLDFMSKRFPEEDSIQEMRGRLLDEEEGLMGSDSDAKKSMDNSASKADSQFNEEQGLGSPAMSTLGCVGPEIRMVSKRYFRFCNNHGGRL